MEQDWTLIKFGIAIDVWVYVSAPNSRSLTFLSSSSAAPPTVPKHFTDEELKQQYGIHLATRLQADGDGKEAKWADIDDDEDDWAPETIEWNDGTKITLSHTDPAAVLAEEQAAALALKDQQEEHNRAKMPPPKPTTTVGPNATVLRLGSGGPPRTGGLLLKNPSDKPTLVAKPSAPTPVRSPWAQLPPIDKVSPVPINAPAQLSAPRSQPPDSSGLEGTGTPTSTTMEIAADSFTRTRRDTQSGSHGQLYNSQSGQYETVNPPRRGSMRKDQNFRPPSLLQRPSPNEQHGPAEPSSAFQTHRSLSQQEATMWNRRASSTMSGDSGPHGRRASMTKGSDIARVPQELLQQRRESQPLQSPLTPSPGHAMFPQENNIVQPTQQQLATPPTAPISSPHLVEGNTTNAMLPPKPVTYGSLAASRTEDDVAAQRELMREKRALAIKRKKEEEQREALEKQERVRLNMLKLERLGISPPDEKKEVEKVIPENKEPGTAPAKKEAESKEVEIKNVESADNESRVVQPDKPKGLNQTVEVAAPRSPPKPPVLDASGTPKQYGLMKMHGPALANGVLPSIERHAADPPKVLAINQQGAASSLEASKGGQPAKSSAKINGDTIEKVESRAPPSPETRNQDLFKAPRQQHWKGIQNDADPYTTWNGTGMTTHSSQVGSLWGLPTNFKALGNGTFDRSVQRPQPRQPFQEHYPTPQPIGPPKHLQRPRESPEPSRALDLMNQTAAEDSQTIPSYPSSDAIAISLVSRGNAASQMINSENPDLASPPIPIPHPKLEVVAERPSRSQDERASLAAWGNFHVTSAREDAEKNRQAAQEKAARLAEEARTGIREPQGPVLNETWRQVVVNETDGKRQVVSSSRSVHDPMVEPQLNGDIRNSPFANPPNIAMGGGAGRGSRFFPGGLPPQPHNVTGLSLGIHRVASPPPPDSSYHPAYFRDQQRPLVNLPSPKPTVRLPPPSAIPVQPTAIVNIPIVPLKPVAQPKVNNAEWQDRFNGLFGVKKPSPEKKFAHVAEFSVTTKVPLEAPMIQISAAVSLPVKDEDYLEQTEDREVISKATEDEEALFENREFGSLPTVLLPKNQHQAIQQKASKIQSRGLARTKEVDPESVKNFEEKEGELSNAAVVFIKLAGMGTRKSKALPRAKNYGSNQGPPRNNRHPAANPKIGKSFKPRESSGSYGSTQKPIQQNNTPRNALPNGVTSQPRSQFGKQNLNWANQRVANAV